MLYKVTEQTQNTISLARPTPRWFEVINGVASSICTSKFAARALRCSIEDFTLAIIRERGLVVDTLFCEFVHENTISKSMWNLYRVALCALGIASFADCHSSVTSCWIDQSVSRI